MANPKSGRQTQRRGRGILFMARGLLLVLMWIGLSGGCAHDRAYPVFPLPNEHVATVLDDLSEKNYQVREWLNHLLDLCQQLGTCEEEK